MKTTKSKYINKNNNPIEVEKFKSYCPFLFEIQVYGFLNLLQLRVVFVTSPNICIVDWFFSFPDSINAAEWSSESDTMEGPSDGCPKSSPSTSTVSSI